ncbi:helix-turn-helix transcriptional regulator [Bacillus sp. UNCCL81]|uniref:helix-turn-helix domain-containing protein n=1 Tax=Bacillus sp. UNCCL81 TaxID=1502755 RepID=UPI0004262CA9|nr:helix-turn-helix transcriptional regulator [Bacillus sp. UNCCL81]SFD60549.1 Helix-turn-helix domain-containing protein [Bacillus sp. UNCCL81]
MNDVGTRIKELRDFRKLSQDDLADALQNKGFNISRVTVSKMENGDRKIDINEIKVISEILNVDFSYFFEDEEEEVDKLVTLFRKNIKNLNEEDELFLGDIFITVEQLISQEKLYKERNK